MRPFSPFLLVAFMLSMALSEAALAQAPQGAPPQVHTDGRVTFSLIHPAADTVLVASWEFVPVLGQQHFGMTRTNAGGWEATVGPLPPGIYDYWFELDGLRITDPYGAAVFGQRLGARGYVEVPGPADTPRPDAFRTDIAHGALTSHWYPSAITADPRRAHVYTPPSYHTSPEATYPVFFLLHGAGDDDRHWAALGRAHVILDNLIAEGRAKEMVVVMPDGMPAVPGDDGTDRFASWAQMYDLFTKDVMAHLLPYVEARYRISEEPAQRAIAGLSMGGGQALQIGLGHHDQFAYVGAFSSATHVIDPILDAVDVDAANDDLRLLWVAIGKDDFLLSRHDETMARIRALGLEHDYFLTEGAHMWSLWRDYLATFVPLLFQ